MSFKSTFSRNTGKELPVWSSSNIGEGSGAAFSLTVEIAPTTVVSDGDVSAIPIPNGGTAPYTNVSFQWHQADDANGTNEADIAGATSSSFYLPTTYNGKFIGCTVIVSDSKGSTATVTEYTQAAVVTATSIATPSLSVPADGAGSGTFTAQTSTSTSLTTDNIPGGWNVVNVGGSSDGAWTIEGATNNANPATTVLVGGKNDGSSASNSNRVWYTTGSTSLSNASISGSTSSVMRTVACDGTNFVCGTEESASGTKIWYSSNGTSWSASSGLSYYRTFSLGSDGTNFYACTFTGSPSSHRSTNGGSSWSTTGAVGLGKYYSCVRAGKMYINPDGNNYPMPRYVTSSGSVQNATMTGGTSAQEWTGAACNPDGQVVIVHGVSSGIWRSTNGGTTFSNISGSTGYSRSGHNNSLVNLGTDYFVSLSGYVSKDGGQTWTFGANINSPLGVTAQFLTGSPTSFTGSYPKGVWTSGFGSGQGKAAYSVTGELAQATVSMVLQNTQVFDNSNGTATSRRLVDTFPTGTAVSNSSGNGTGTVSTTPSGATLELKNRTGTWTNGDRAIRTSAVSVPGPYNNAITFTGSTPALTRGVVNNWGNAEFQVSTSSGDYSSAMTDTVAISDPTINQTLPPTGQTNINMSTGTQYYARIKYSSADPVQQSSYSTQNAFITNDSVASGLPSGWTNTSFGTNAFFRSGTSSPPSFPSNYENLFGPVIDLPQTNVYRFMTILVSRNTSNNNVYHFICRSVDGRSWELEDITQYMDFSTNAFNQQEYLLSSSDGFVWREGNEIAISYDQNQTRLGRGTYLYSNDLGESWSNIKIPLSSWQTAAYGNNQNPEPIDFSKRGSEYFIITRYGVSKHTGAPSASNWQAVQAYPKSQYINGFPNGIIWNSDYSVGFAHQGKISGSSANEPCITTTGGSTWAVPANWNVGSTISGQTVDTLRAAIYLVSENKVLVQNQESSTKACIFMFTMDGNGSGISVVQTSTAQSEIMNASFASRSPVNGNIAFIGYGEQSASTSKLLLNTTFTVGNPTGWTYSEFDSSNRGGRGSYNQMGELTVSGDETWNSNPDL